MTLLLVPSSRVPLSGSGEGRWESQVTVLQRLGTPPGKLTQNAKPAASNYGYFLLERHWGGFTGRRVTKIFPVLAPRVLHPSNSSVPG